MIGSSSEVSVSYRSETPFDSIEGSYEYVELLAAEIEAARKEIDEEVSLASSEGAERRTKALQLVAYNLMKLGMHVTTSKRILNDLRTLRRLLLAERVGEPEVAQARGAGQA